MNTAASYALLAITCCSVPFCGPLMKVWRNNPCRNRSRGADRETITIDQTKRARKSLWKGATDTVVE